MKKNYFMLAATAALFAACAETDLVNEIVVEETPQAISFETFAQKATRTTENSNTSYTQDLGAHHSTFEVYAYKNVSDTKVFDDETVTYTAAVEDESGAVTTPAKWSYEGLVYWDKTASEYNFYAAAPAANYWKFNDTKPVKDENDEDKKDEAGNIITEITKDEAYFTIESHSITDHNASVVDDHTYVDVFGETSTDLMIASKEQVTSTSTQPLFEEVQLDFIHILSRLNITVSKDESLEDKVVTLNSLEVYNMNGTASFNESLSSGSTLSAGTNTRWTSTNRTNITYTSLEEEALNVVSTNNPAEYMLQSLVIPQDVTYEPVSLDGKGKESLQEAYFCITYTIEDKDANDRVLSSEQFIAYYNLAAVFGATASDNNANNGDERIVAFNEGWQNTLNITIKPTAIVFNSKVATWAENPVDQIIN